ncbi:MAG: helix-turn-helix domain-containing protein [Candidatus Nanosalina sp.]
MPYLIRTGEKNEKLEASSLDEESLKALSEPIRRQILEELARNPSYPREVARSMEVDKQKVYYHFNKLEEAGLLEEARTEKVSGGSATYYRSTAPAYVLDFGIQGDEIPWSPEKSAAEDFLNPLVDQGALNGRIVVGSPDQHGPDQVQARDGHLAGEVGLKLGNYCVGDTPAVSLDTEVFRNSSFSQNMLMVGGVLTNTVTKKFNEEFPASFEGENFPYREIKTPENTYSEDSIGVVAKTRNPEDPEKSIFMVAGVRNQGTEAAVRAFKNLEDIVEDYGEGEFYRVVRGLDMDGDGEIDDFEVVE